MALVIVVPVHHGYDLLEMRVALDLYFVVEVLLPVEFIELLVIVVYLVPLHKQELAPEGVRRVQGHLVLEFGEKPSHHVYHYAWVRLLVVEDRRLAGQAVGFARVWTAQA